MKKIFFSLAVVVATMASAQVLNVVSMERMAVPTPIQNVRVAAISPTGDYLLLTDFSNHGLTRFDVASCKTSVLSTAQRAGMDAVISEDGNDILFRESVIDANHKWSESVIHTNLPTMRRKVLVAQSTNLGSVSRSMLPSRSNRMSIPEVSINHDLQIEVKVNGETRILMPQGKEMSYIWATLSPDRTKISYYCSEIGGFVCDLTGKVIAHVGKNCRAAKWLDNETLVGHEAHSDGKDYTSAYITACTLDGKCQRLTDARMKALLPVVGGGKIAFSNLAGEVYMMTVSK